MRRGRLMLAPLLTATSGAAWASPYAFTAAGEVPPLPPIPPSPDTVVASASAGLQTPYASLFIMHPELDGQRLAQVTAEFNIIELRGIEAGSLERALGDRLPAAQRAALRREAGNFVPVVRLQQLGIIATYDPANLTLKLALVPEAAGAPILGFADDPGGSPDGGDPQGDARLIHDLAGLMDFAGRERIGDPIFTGLIDRAEEAQRKLERDLLFATRGLLADPALRVPTGSLVAGLPLIGDTAEIAAAALYRGEAAVPPLRDILPTGRRRLLFERPALVAAAEDTIPAGAAEAKPESRSATEEVPPPTPPAPPPPPSPPSANPAVAATSIPATPGTRAPRVSRITLYPVLGGNRLPLVTAELTVAELRGIDAGSLELALGDKLAAAHSVPN